MSIRKPTADFFDWRRAPEYIRYDADLIRIVQHFFAENKPVAVVCHGAEILAAANVISGKRIATVAKCKLDVELCGATFVNEGCVRAANMVSRPTWHDQHEYMREFMGMLQDQVQKEQDAAKLFNHSGLSVL